LFFHFDNDISRRANQKKSNFLQIAIITTPPASPAATTGSPIAMCDCACGFAASGYFLRRGNGRTGVKMTSHPVLCLSSSMRDGRGIFINQTPDHRPCAPQTYLAGVLL
jgi:hypothetical protein